MILAALALVIAACGDDGEPSDSDDTSADEEQDDGDGETAGDQEPVQGGTLVVGTMNAVEGVDPTTYAGGVVTGTQSFALYDSLMKLDEDGEVVPSLAESLETEDNQTWTLNLREGITFHDGTPLDAEAVVFNIERHMDPEVQSQSAGTVTNYQSVEAVDEHTVEFTLEFPWLAFPQTLTGPVGAIASPTALEELGEDYHTGPVGAGPFTFVEWRVDSLLKLERNPDYFKEGQPYVDEIEFRPVPDGDTRNTSLRTEDLDVAQSISGGEISEARDESGLDAASTTGNGGGINIFNVTEPPFDDVRARRAVYHALDLDAITEVVFDGAVEPLNGPFSEESPFYSDPDFPDYDPEEAQRLADEIEDDTGEPLSFEWSCHNESTRVRLGEVMQQMLAEVGIEMTPNNIEIGQYLQQVMGGATDYEMGCFTHGAFQDPDPSLYNAFHSETIDQGYTTGYSSEEMDEALETGRFSTDFDERYEAYATVQELLAEDVPVHWYASNIWGWMFQEDVHGLSTLSNANFNPEDVWIEEG